MAGKSGTKSATYNIYIYIGEIIEHNGVDVEANHVLLPEGNKGLLTNNNHVYTGES